MGQHAGRFRRMREEVEGQVRVLHAGHGGRVVRVHEVRELDGIADKEYGPVNPDNVPVTLLRVELDSKPAWVASLLGRSAITHHGGKSNKDRGLRSGRKDPGVCQRADVGARREVAEETRPAGMNDSLRDTFPIETLKLFDKVRVLQDDRTRRTGRLRILIVSDRRPVITGHIGSLRKRSHACYQSHRENACRNLSNRVFHVFSWFSELTEKNINPKKIIA